ncbi:hypothetical protein LG311_10225 [Sutcliffiella horikoshii]|uniref:hypothetical protein n=1 Tax=Sutcliffiella horikoshii TaxID=79883 RepID=UPI0038514790
MKIKELVAEYKNGSSTDKLSIVSSVITIFTAVLTIIVGQVLTLRFAINVTTFIVLGYYLFALGLSLTCIFLFIQLATFTWKLYESFILKLGLVTMLAGVSVLILLTIWDFIISLN